MGIRNSGQLSCVLLFYCQIDQWPPPHCFFVRYLSRLTSVTCHDTSQMPDRPTDDSVKILYTYLSAVVPSCICVKWSKFYILMIRAFDLNVWHRNGLGRCVSTRIGSLPGFFLFDFQSQKSKAFYFPSSPSHSFYRKTLYKLKKEIQETKIPTILFFKQFINFQIRKCYNILH